MIEKNKKQTKNKTNTNQYTPDIFKKHFALKTYKRQPTSKNQ
jgi:hypothetical protein